MKIKSRPVLIWLLGIPLLLGLNLRKDLSQLSDELEWHTVKRSTLNKSVPSLGIIEAVVVETIKSDVRETVQGLKVNEGDYVKKDQILMVLTRTNTQLEFEQNKNSYTETKINYRKALRELKIQKKLLKDFAVSQTQVEEAARDVQRKKAALDIAQREFDLMKEKLEGTTVRSPIDGQVLEVFVRTGERVGADSKLISVGDTSQFVVKAQVDELDIRQVKLNQPVEIRADAYPDIKITGKVKSIATQASREAFAKIAVDVEITNDGGIDLKHNLSGRVNILTDKIPNAIGIPITAIQRKEGDKARVLVKSKIGFIRKKKIVLGASAGDNIEVKSGLKENDEVGLTSTQKKP